MEYIPVRWVAFSIAALPAAGGTWLMRQSLINSPVGLELGRAPKIAAGSIGVSLALGISYLQKGNFDDASKRLLRVTALASGGIGVSMYVASAQVPSENDKTRGVCGACLGVFSTALFWWSAKNFPPQQTLADIRATINTMEKKQEAEDKWRNKELGRNGLPLNSTVPDVPVWPLKAGGESSISLLNIIQNDEGPTVLSFSSFTCLVHRSHLSTLDELYNKYQGQGVKFVTMYVAEAHPQDGWVVNGQFGPGEEFGASIHYATNLEERRECATKFVETKNHQWEVVLDGMDDHGVKTFNAYPIRLYILHGGKVKYVGLEGPHGYNPREAENALKDLLK